MPPKKNIGPCSIRNCQSNSNQFCRITKYVLTKIKTKDILNQYNYLEIKMQLCFPHYLSIIEPDHNDRNKLPTNDTLIIENNQTVIEMLPFSNSLENTVNKKQLSFDDKITLMTKVLYEKQKKEDQLLELDSDNF
ncbi:5467_t:CDS:1 [Cetraspora pellucida]|uniref:5467_t:CDS:1 n=1 Tax=Cetraspora pellucida TaxID=1433469 RepID=A0A9N9BFC3_9GLOM|nr:5467_t:CDS:1 [Cetraspora pellucida]